VWSAEKRAEGLEYMHPKPSSHSGRIVGNPEVGGIGTCRVPHTPPLPASDRRAGGLNLPQGVAFRANTASVLMRFGKTS